MEFLPLSLKPVMPNVVSMALECINYTYKENSTVGENDAHRESKR